MDISIFEKLGIVKYDFPLKSVCSMKTGGNAEYAFFPRNREELCDVLRFVKSNDIKYIVIGFSSNVIFSDEGYHGAIIFTVEMKEYYPVTEERLLTECKKLYPDKNYYYADSGASLTAFSLKTLKDGLAGLEFAYGIPASVGGAIYMNAGAYGGEISQVLACVEYIDTDGEIKILRNLPDSPLFSYRHSPFSNDDGKVIIGGVFALSTADGNTSMETALQNMQARKTKQPLEYPNCGSAFKRPVGNYAGALIEKAGLKGFSIGGAAVSEKHAGFIINKGNATSSDVLKLMEYVSECVFEKFGVKLESEIKIIE